MIGIPFVVRTRFLATSLAVLALLVGGTADRAAAVDRHVPGTFSTIQEAIDEAETGDHVVLADGTYTGPGNVELTYYGKEITVRSASGNPANCIIDCQNLTFGFYLASGETTSSVLNGITIRNGYDDQGGAGGIFIFGSAPTIENCVFSNNVTALVDGIGGSAIVSLLGAPQIINCTFIGNSALGTTHSGIGTSAAGGAYVGLLDAPLFVFCTFRENTATGGDGEIGPDDTGGSANGGACAFAISIPAFYNCVFEGNVAQGGFGGGYAEGGAIVGYSCKLLIAGCVFSGNRAVASVGNVDFVPASGGAVSIIESVIGLVNSTFSGNSALGDDGSVDGDGYGGAVFSIQADEHNSFLYNCILWGNTNNGEAADAEYVLIDGEIDRDYNIIQNAPPAGGNDPLFVRAPFTGGPTDYGDLRVQTGSPAIDNGLDDAPNFVGLTRDVADNDRFVGATVDIGAYEYFVPSLPPVANAGADQRVTGRYGAIVTLDGSASSDPGGGALSYAWTLGVHPLATGATPSLRLDPGKHQVTLTVTNPGGLSNTDTVEIWVDYRVPTVTTVANYTVTRGVAKKITARVKNNKGQLLNKPIQIYVDGSLVGSVMSGDPAGFMYTAPKSMARGKYPLVVKFAGDTEHQDSQAATTVTVAR